MRRLILCAALLSCASPGMPPGGPEDRLPPEVVSVTPDSGTLNARPRQVVFRFDEVVSERPSGAPSLDRLFLISPRDGDPKVSWHRNSISVRPRKGWRPNTVYTVTMLPGLADLRNNIRKQGARALFSTGGEIPGNRIEGIVFDWIAGKPAPRAAIEAITADSTVYVASADSTGRFQMLHLPLGTYQVRAFMDANSNRSLDPREAWDSLEVTLAGSANVELLAFVHDTIGPRINTVAVTDSLTLRVSFDKPIHPNVVVEPALFKLMTADSAAVPILSALSAKTAELDRVAAEKAKQDSTRSADSTTRSRDTTQRVESPRIPMPNRAGARRDTTPVPIPSRPIPEQEVVLRLGTPLVAGATYRLRAIEIEGMLRVKRTSDRVFTLPKKPVAKPDSLAAPKAGERPALAPRDTTRRVPPSPPDSARRPPRQRR